MTLSLRARLTAFYTVALVVVLCLFGANVWWVEGRLGLRRVDGGSVVVDGQDVTSVGVQEHFDSGLGHIPEDRQRRGLVLEFSIAENIAIHDYRSKPDSRFGWLSPSRLI